MGLFARLAAAEITGRVALYFFDLRSAHAFSRDADGVELPDLEAAHDMAFDALVDLARKVIDEGSTDQHFAIEVRNGTGPVLELSAVFNSRILRKQ